MFFLLLLVGAAVALPLQSQPETEDTLPVIDWNLVKVSLGEESDNLFDDILKAVQVATPIVTALAGKRDVADSEWFDTFLAAVEAATPTIVDVIQGAGTTREVADSEWFDTFLAAVEAATPTILGVIQGATTTREVADAEWFNTLINAVEAFTPTIVGMINNVKQRKALNWLDEILKVTDQSPPLITGLLEPAKKRQVQDNMFIDGADLINTITPAVSPIINALTGKRQAESELENQDNLFDIFVDALGVIAPVISAGKRDCWGCIDPLVIPEITLPLISAGRRDTFDEETFFEKYLHEIGYPVLPEGLIIVKKEA